MMYMKVVSLGRTRAEGEDKGGGGRGRGGDMYSLHKGHKSGTPTCLYACSDRLHTTHEYSSDVHIEGSTN